MTSRDINYRIKVSDGGTLKSTNQDAKALGDNLGRAADNAARVPKAVAAARAGVEKTNESNLARSTRGSSGVGEGTGSSARDFAKQSQGLGGLVHLYATFAANIYAAGAAYNALSKAMDTANMVKGLDQLGAASGKSLGTLAKQLANVTDGAISLREAMTATAQATAGGMTSEAILRMGKIAKNASQALGVDMTNAVSRITRGIVKLEPELLDEIGIMVRVDRSVESYARSVGKAVSSLTEFERRQAFANAVLEQGEKKFGDIKIDSNPYSKLAASMSNLTTSGLNLLNTVLSPIANILASSPVALAAAIGGLVTVLARQAMPRLTDIKNNLKDSADRYNETAQRLAASKLEARDFKNDEVFTQQSKILADAKAEISSSMAAYNTALAKSARGKVASIMKSNVSEFNDEQTKAISDRIKTIGKDLNNHTDKSKVLTDKRVADLKIELALLKRIESQINAIGAARKRIDEEEVKPERIGANTLTVIANVKRLEKAKERAAKSSILAKASEDASIGGVAYGLSSLGENIKKYKGELAQGGKSLGTFGTAALYARGGIAVLGTALSSVMVLLGNLFAYVAIATAAFSALDAVFGSAKEESEAFSAATESVTAAIKTAMETSEKAEKTGLTVESIQARATAMYELASAFDTQADKFNKFNKAKGVFTSGVDWVKGLFNFGSKQDLAEGLRGTIQGVLASVDDEVRGDTAAKFKEILNLGDLNDLSEIKDKLASGTLGLAAFREEIKRMGTDAANSASRLSSLSSGLGELSKAVSDQINSLNPSDSFGKIGVQAIALSSGLTKAFEDPKTALIALNKIVDDTKLMAMLPKEDVARLMQFKREIRDVEEGLRKSSAKIKELQDKKAKTNKGSELISLQRDISAEENIVKGLKEKQADLQGLFSHIGFSMFQAGGMLLTRSISTAMQEASISSAKTYLNIMKSAGMQTAEAEGRLRQQEIGVQREVINSQYNLALVTERLSIEMERNTLQEQISNESAKRGKPGVSDAEVDAKVKALNKSLEISVRKLELLNSGNLGAKFAAASSAKPGSLTDVDKGAFAGLGNIAAQTAGRDRALIGLNAQSSNAALETKANVIRELATSEEASLRRAQEQLKLEQTTNTLMQSRSVLFNADLEQAREALELASINNEFEQKRVKLQSDLNILRLQEASNADDLRKQKEAIAQKEGEINALASARATTIANAELQAFDRRIDGERQLRTIKEEILSLDKDRLYTIDSASLQTSSAKLEYLKQYGLISSQQYNIESSSLKNRKEDVELANQLARIESSRARTLGEIDDDIKKAKSVSGNDANVALLQGKRDSAAAVFTAQAAAAAELSAANKRINEDTKQQIALEEARTDRINKQTEATKSAASAARELATAFGDVGSSIGQMIEAYQENTKAQIEAEEALNKAKKTNDPKIISEAQIKYAKDRENAELGMMSSILGAGRKLFKEQSKMGQAMAKAEKVLAAYKFAMAIKQMFIDNAVVNNKMEGETSMTAASAAETFRRVELSGTEAQANAVTSVTNQGKGDPYSAFFRIAAMIALMASITGKKVSGGSVSAGSAQARQEVQGTGQSLDALGNKVDNGAGVFGDSTAKSEAVNKSIEMIEAHGFENLEYSNKMLDALIAIRENTDSLGKAILRIGGLTIANPTITAGNWLTGKDKTETIDKGIQVSGSIGEIRQGAGSVEQYINTLITKKGFLGLSSKESLVSEVKAIEDESVKRSIGAIFDSISDALGAAGEQLGITGTEEFINSINVSEAFKISAMGLKGEELVAAIVAQVGIEMDLVSKQMFPELEKFQDIGESFSETVIRVAREGQLVSLAFESVGMSLSTLAEEGTRASAEQIARLQQAKAGYAAALADTEKPTSVLVNRLNPLTDVMETVTVVTTGSTESFEALKVAQEELAAASAEVIAANKTLTTNNLDAQQRIIELSGGIEAFLDQSSFFKDNFLTEAERLAPVQARVTAELTRLGYASVDTREEFKNLVLGLDVTDKASAELYAALMKVAPAFAEVHEKAEELNLEDYAKKLREQQIEIAKLSGDMSAAVKAGREDIITELLKLSISDEQKKLLVDNQNQIWKLEDAAKVRKLEIDLLQATGHAYVAVLAQREEELKALTIEEQALKRRVYAEQDAAKTASLEIELLEAQGKAQEALKAKRMLELKGLSLVDAELKRRIWLLQDEKALLDKKLDQEARIYTLLGKSEEALQITRQRELDALDAQLIPNQLYIYALEDEAAIKEKLKTAYEKESSAIKATVSSMRDAIKSLKDYRDALLLGETSILTPMQKYSEAKRQAMQLAAIATSIAVTDADKQKKDDALNKLPGALDAYLEASRVVYASSATYTDDFNTVMRILDQTTTTLENQQTDAERQLSQLEQSNTILGIIEEHTKSTAELMDDLVAAQAKTLEAMLAAAAAGSAAAGGTFTNPVGTPVTGTSTGGAYMTVGASGLSYGLDAMIHGTSGLNMTVADIRKAVNDIAGTGQDKTLYDAVVKQGVSSAMMDSILGAPPGTSLAWALSRNFPAFASGGLAYGQALVGEQGPELVDFASPGRVYSAANTSVMLNNDDIVSELRQLRAEVSTLRAEQKEQTGHIIATNYDANKKNADAINEANKPSNDQWKERTKAKLA